MTRLADAIDRLAGLCGALALLAAIVAVAARYVFRDAVFDWADEAMVMLLVWGMLLTCLRTTIEGKHIAVDLFSHGRSGRLTRIMSRFSKLALFLFALAMAAAGIIVTSDAIQLGEHTESTLRLPTAIYYASLPVGMALIALGVAFKFGKGGQE